MFQQQLFCQSTLTSRVYHRRKITTYHVCKENTKCTQKSLGNSWNYSKHCLNYVFLAFSNWFSGDFFSNLEMITTEIRMSFENLALAIFKSLKNLKPILIH
jgi:hypothetical protein